MTFVITTAEDFLKHRGKNAQNNVGRNIESLYKITINENEVC